MNREREIDKINETIRKTNESIKIARRYAKEATILATISILINLIVLGVRLTM